MMVVHLLEASFWKDRERGWHWYRDDKQEEKDPKEQLAVYKKDLEEKLTQAIVEPSRKNIKAYQVAQKKLVDMSQEFAVAWSKSILNHPELDETVKNPVSFYGGQVAYHVKQQHKEKRIRELSSTYGLFFFFKSDCTYCHSFARVVQHFSKKYNWSVVAISTDGSTLEQFPDAIQDNGIIEQLGVEYAPSLYLINPKEEMAVAVSHGLSALDTIEDNIITQLGDNHD